MTSLCLFFFKRKLVFRLHAIFSFNQKAFKILIFLYDNTRTSHNRVLYRWSWLLVLMGALVFDFIYSLLRHARQEWIIMNSDWTIKRGVTVKKCHQTVGDIQFETIGHFICDTTRVGTNPITQNSMVFLHKSLRV